MELQIKNVKIYWNSMSEMFIPTSLWESTKHLQYQIFEAMDASQIHELMTDAFDPKGQLNNFYLLKPFSIFISMNFNKSYNPQYDPYKYQVRSLSH